MLWIKQRNPNVVFLIENPRGYMKEMPVMKDLEKEFDLRSTTVNYCRFGYDVNKPTNLWTNDYELFSRLNDQHFKCTKDTCPYFSGRHPEQVRGDSKLDHSAIPSALAEEVADYMQSKCYWNRVNYRKAASKFD